MRALSATAASACEHATSKRCRCRCGGAYHGAARYDDDDDAYLLDEGDPHLPALGANGRQLRLGVGGQTREEEPAHPDGPDAEGPPRHVFTPDAPDSTGRTRCGVCGELWEHDAHASEHRAPTPRVDAGHYYDPRGPGGTCAVCGGPPHRLPRRPRPRSPRVGAGPDHPSATVTGA